MNLRVKKLYELSIKDETFLSEIEKADNDKKPGPFAPEKLQALFATLYFGWLVGKGLWKSEIIEPIMTDAVIIDLKKGDRFKFNYDTFLVTRKYIDDDRPLTARHEISNELHKFDWEGLEIKKIKQ